MDPQQFDDVAKVLATPTSRRKALQLLAGLAEASALSALPIRGSVGLRDRRRRVPGQVRL
jgi:hypothetical protein